MIVPSFTFVSTANAFVLRGARRCSSTSVPDTLEHRRGAARSADHAVGRKAIVVVHYAGVACDMDAIRRHRLAARDRGHRRQRAWTARRVHGARPLGSFGALATLSFHETKNFTCGEGGALVINDPRYIERAEILREKGTDRSRFFRGQVDKYGWIDVGSSYLPSDLLAAFLLAQLESRDRDPGASPARLGVVPRRARANGRGIRRRVAPRARRVPAGVPPVLSVVLPSLDERQALIQHLQDRACIGRLPLSAAASVADGSEARGTTWRLSGHRDASATRLLRLPFYNDLSEQDQSRVD